LTGIVFINLNCNLYIVTTMKEAIMKGLEFATTRLGLEEFHVLGCDYDSRGNVCLFCNLELPNYSRAGQIYEKSIPLASLTSNQYKALHRYLVVGPCLRKTNLPESASIYTEDLEAGLFEVDKAPDYVFLPTVRITRTVLGDGKPYERIMQYLATFPPDCILAHEAGHKKAVKVANEMAEQFGCDDTFGPATCEETLAKYAEMLYLEENYPELYERRRQEFLEDVSTLRAPRDPDEIYPDIICDPLIKSPHVLSSEQYLAIEKEGGSRDFVDSLLFPAKP